MLAEDELVAIDLSTEGWPTYRLPYLANVGLRSPVTSALHVTAVTDTLRDNIVNAGKKQFGQYSTRVSKCLCAKSCILNEKFKIKLCIIYV